MNNKYNKHNKCVAVPGPGVSQVPLSPVQRVAPVQPEGGPPAAQGAAWRLSAGPPTSRQAREAGIQRVDGLSLRAAAPSRAWTASRPWPLCTLKRRSDTGSKDVSGEEGAQVPAALAVSLWRGRTARCQEDDQCPCSRPLEATHCDHHSPV